MLKSKFILKAVIASTVLFCQSAIAFTFIPTQQEFFSWNRKCQALYLSTDIAKKTPFVGYLPESEIRDVRKSKHGGGWHYCAGLVHIRRAKNPAATDYEVDASLHHAISEVQFTVRNIEKKNPWYSEIGVTLGDIYKLKGEHKKAIESYNTVIGNFPLYGPAYSAKALLLKDQGKLTEAIKVLEGVDELVINNSAEINYFLGLFYFKLGKLQQASKYSDKAYSLGYPLPWLKQQIKKAKAAS